MYQIFTARKSSEAARTRASGYYRHLPGLHIGDTHSAAAGEYSGTSKKVHRGSGA